MSGWTTLLVEREGPILWVRLNRPDALNAYCSEMSADETPWWPVDPTTR